MHADDPPGSPGPAGDSGSPPPQPPTPPPPLVPRRARIGWGIGDFFWVLGAQILAANLVFGVLAIDGEITTDESLVWALPAQSVAMAIALVLIARRKGRGSLSADFGFEVSIRDWTAIFVGLGWRFLVIVALAPLVLLLDAEEPAQQVVQDLEEAGGTVVWIAIFVWIVGVQPALEEILFRGLLLRALLRRTTTAWAVIISGGGFGLIHLLGVGDDAAAAAVTVVGLAGFGMALSVQALRHGSLSRPILTHAAFNLTGVVALAAG